MTTGVFITLEGGEGAGKSTHIARLSDTLHHHGYTVMCTREPGGTDFAESVRALLVQDNGYDISAHCELALLISARLNHVQTRIKPALLRGEVVLCDRYIDSSLVYQGLAGSMGINAVLTAHKVLMGDDFILPHMTVCLDIPPTIGIKRSQGMAKNEDRFEKKDLAFHQTINQGFLDIARTDKRYVVVDATCAYDDVFVTIWNNVQRVLGHRGDV